MEVLYLHRVFYLLCGLVYLTKSKHCLMKESCDCLFKAKRVICRHMSYIPKLPPGTLILQLVDCHFPYITRETFSNVSSVPLESLILKNNSMETIEQDAFSDFNFLRKLEISYEKKLNKTDLNRSFKSLNVTNLEVLMFEQNNWTTLPRHMFQHLSGANLTYISLNYNNLKKLYFNIFRPLSGLKKLSCRENAIAYMNVSTFHTLQHLDLSENNIYVMPTFCDVINNKSAVPLLKNLSLFNNAIRDISIRSFKCLENLESLILDGNRIRTLDNNVFSTLIKLNTLSLCKLSQLKNINSRAFNSSSLQILRFNENRYRFDKKIRYDSKEIEIFHFLPNIRELHLAQNYLPKDDNILRQMFEHLTNLRKINLHSTYISLVPEVLNTLPHLNSIILQGNKIDRWNASTFENMTSLRKLNIAGNTIHIINKTSFPMSLLNGLETFDLSTNPYWCTCDQKWFLDTIRLTNLTKKMTSEWPRYYTCSYPERLRFTMLSNYNPTDSDCTPWNVISLIIITVSSAVLVIFFVVIVLFRCQINIKNVLYFVRVYRQATKGYLKLDSSDEFEFDAFVVYCDADRQWVHNVLLKKLESSNLNICIHHRDFDVGEHITNNIEKYMSKCWKIIVVMSNQFAESEWCQWEIDLVHERRRRQGKKALVLIMYRQIDSRHMTSSLRTLLGTTPHLSYKEGIGEILFWNTVIRDVSKPLNYPPVAVL